MKSNFLETAVPLTKTFNLVDGKIEKIGHPNVAECTSHEERWETLEQFAAALRRHASEGHCLLKGNLSRPLKSESRAGTTNANEPTNMICFDLDGVQSVKDVDGFLDLVGARDVDHVVQFSASMGVLPDKGLSAHVFMLVEAPKVPAFIKQWLIGLNMQVPALRSGLKLTATHNALRYPLDVTTCQNDKLIYIAPPVLGKGVKDGLRGERIRFVKRKRRALPFPTNVPTVEANRVETEKAINQLREGLGLPKRKKFAMKAVGGVDVLKDPDAATITGMKEERGFVYFNLNDGDSWAYYHPVGNPSIIHNFKGEPPYLTEELLPEYWAQVRKDAAEPKFDEHGTIYLAFRDFRTATYWNGTYNRETKDLRIAPARSAEQLKHFLKQHGQPVGDYVPDWTVAFDPHSADIVNVEARFVNKFRPTKYMQMKHPTVLEVPPLTRRVILHALGSDEESFEHYMNWLACIFQHKNKTGTAWVMHGIPGTGKGLLLNEVLRPLFGKHVVSRRTREMESQFNGYMEEALIMNIDEAEVALQQQASLIEADLKNYIVEPMVSIRNMYMMPYEARNYMNVMLVSNKGEVIHIDPNDRRFNVAPFQSVKLDITDAELATLRAEVEEFSHYLASRDADQMKARTPLNNAAKQTMVMVGMQALDGVSNAVRDGDLQFLWDQRQVIDMPVISVARDMVKGAYMNLLRKIALGEKPALLREEVHLIMEHNVGGMPQTPHKFAALMKHHRIMFEPVMIDGKRVRGIEVRWKIGEELKTEILGKEKK